MGECGGKWETKIMLINGGAVCCRECNLDSAAPIGRIRESANPSETLVFPLTINPDITATPSETPIFPLPIGGLRTSFNAILFWGSGAWAG